MNSRLVVRVHPGARRDAIRGTRADGSLQVEVTAPPEDGRANRAVCELLATALGVAKTQVQVVRGATSRTKQVAIEGLAPDELVRRLAATNGGRET